MKSSKTNTLTGFKCNVCGQVKPTSEFWPSYISKSIHKCKDCHYKQNPKKGRPVVSQELREAIRNDKEGLNGKELARKYGVSDTVVYRILNTGRTKAIRERNTEIRLLFEKGIPLVVLMEKFGLPEKRIEGIVKT